MHKIILLIAAIWLTACASDGGGGVAGDGDSGPTCSDCPGCCAGTSCVAFSQQDDTTCGANGSACAACDFGFRCAKGSCIVDTNVCSPASCLNGCCSGSACVDGPAQNWVACGSAGGLCSTCSTGLACVGGACDPNHWSNDASFKLTALEIANCACTDVGSSPDPFVILQAPGVTASTNHCQNVVGCKFSTGSIDVTAADLIAGKVTFQIRDEDLTADDTCGMGTIKLPAPIPVQASYEVNVQGQKFIFGLTAK